MFINSSNHFFILLGEVSVRQALLRSGTDVALPSTTLPGAAHPILRDAAFGNWALYLGCVDLHGIDLSWIDRAAPAARD